MAQQEDFGRARLIVLRRKVAPHDGLNAENAKEVFRHVSAGVAAGLTIRGEIDRGAIEVGGHAFERLLFLAELLIVHRVDLIVGAERRLRGRVDEGDVRQSISVRKTESPDHRGIDHREHGGHGADAERQNENGQGGEALVLDQHAEPDSKVLAEGLGDHGRSPDEAPSSGDIPIGGGACYDEPDRVKVPRSPRIKNIELFRSSAAVTGIQPASSVHCRELKSGARPGAWRPCQTPSRFTPEAGRR